MAEVGLLVGFLVDIIVLYYIANFFHVPNNSLGKAVMVTLLSMAIGYVIAPFLIGLLFISLGAFLLFIAASILIRFFLIKMVYGIGFSAALKIWIISALVTVAISAVLPI